MVTLVRTEDRMVFEIDEETLEAKHVSTYDAYCFSDPEPNVKYLGYDDWLRLQRKDRKVRANVN